MSETDKVKIVTKITSFDDVQKSLQEVENRINSLIKSVNDVSEKETSETEGKSGDINITRNADGTYGLETCTNEGWKKMYTSNKTTEDGTSEVYLGDKPRIAAKLSTTEAFTGSVDTRYLPTTPDYESGWLDADANTTVAIAHNLGLTEEPGLVQLYASDNSSPTIGTNPIVTDFHLNENWGYRMHFVDANNINIYIGASGGLYHEGTNTFGGADGDVPLETFTNGYIKLKLWK